MNHRCDYVCVCPVHETPLLYCASTGEHACQDPYCVHAYGIAYQELHDQAVRRVFGRLRRAQEQGEGFTWPTSS